ncbi:hypothetical protein [Capnocytophaga cynodegmi]|nr:hypothetical protein [Capnocytophaga cynodegmi]
MLCINVLIGEEVSHLDEVVVMEYGAQSRNTLTALVSKLDTKTS